MRTSMRSTGDDPGTGFRRAASVRAVIDNDEKLQEFCQFAPARGGRE